jgi:hypothetical protein
MQKAGKRQQKDGGSLQEGALGHQDHARVRIGWNFKPIIS